MRTVPRPGWQAYALIGAVGVAALAGAGYRFGWRDLFLTPDQRGRLLLEHGDAAAAAQSFRDPTWQGVARFRSGAFKEAAQSFAARDTAESAFDQGNTLVMLGQYDDAIKRYDRALALRPGWADAAANREIARIRGERRKAEGGVNDDTESTPDQIVFDKTQKGGEDTTVTGPKAMSNESIQALWLKRVQTRPADFLKVKFSYQLQTAAEGARP